MARNRGRGGRGRPDDAPDKRPSAESVTSRPPPAKRRTDVRIVGAVAVGAAALGALAIALPRARAPAASGGDGACPCDLDAWAPPPDAAEQYVYAPGCDFDVLDAFPSQSEFDAEYWNRRPVLIRNGTARWPREIWGKRTLYDALRRAALGGNYLKTTDEWASMHLMELHDKTSLADFLCSGVCRPPDGLDQTYVFDRDDWRASLPEVEAAIVTPDVIASHYDPSWHTRWSKYFLISALGSGINFHRHTNAFNGLVHGRKRWFLYPHSTLPPAHKTGMLEWWRTVYVPELRATHDAGPAGDSGLLQCMQEAGDVVYVPQQMWHATLALGEGVGVSGQFVRSTAEILARATEHAQAARHHEAAALYEAVLAHRDEVEKPIQIAVAANLGVVMLNAGERARAERAARLSLQLHAEYGVGSPSMAHAVLAKLGIPPPATTTPAPPQ